MFCFNVKTGILFKGERNESSQCAGGWKGLSIAAHARVVYACKVSSYHGSALKITTADSKGRTLDYIPRSTWSIAVRERLLEFF